MPDVFAGLPVTELERARAWYERLTGAAPDMRPNDEEYVWRLAEQAWIYVVRDPRRAGHGLLTVVLDDLDAQLAALAGRGLEPDETEELTQVRTAAFHDPDGNRITFGQPK